MTLHPASSRLWIVAALMACAPLSNGASTATATPAPQVVRADTIATLLRRLTVRQKVGQLVMPWLLADYAATDAPTMVKARMWVDSLQVGGIIISTGTPLDMAAKLNALQRRAPLPLLISADFEGGTTMRVAAGTGFPTQMGVAATGKVEDAYTMGLVTGREARAMGVHLAFAPVADVNSNPDNPIINTRSFGSDPRAVGALVAATVRGLKDGGVLATAKHFPGHGDTDTDSHLAMPSLPFGYARMDTLELIPFRSAISAGVDAIMSAHIALPAMDSGVSRPGTLSPAILTGLLQDSLHFTGLVTTDALDMGAIVKTFGAEEAVIRAFEAGTDILLMPADPASAITAMTKAVESGRISMARLDRSVRKILELKVKMGLFRQREVDLAKVPDVVGTAASQAVAAGITSRALVLLKDSLGTVDALRAAPRKVALVSIADVGSTLGTALATELRAAGYTVTAARVSTTEPTPKELAAATAAIDGAESVVLATSARWGSYSGVIGLAPATADLLKSLAARKPAILISFGSPYIIAQVPAAASYLIAWSNTTLAEKAVAQALSGRKAITGRAPIPIPPLWSLGTGLQRTATRGQIP
ncbi:MAG: glycoside hydrolase family 3 N-terminal domain-containing protein [Gemmatimonadales bacterium]